jgi:hypothetical protein
MMDASTLEFRRRIRSAKREGWTLDDMFECVQAAVETGLIDRAAGLELMTGYRLHWDNVKL